MTEPARMSWEAILSSRFLGPAKVVKGEVGGGGGEKNL